MREIDQDLWVDEAPQRYRGVEIGTRMTVIRLANDELILHNPVPLSASTRDSISALGSVRAVISASLMHHMYVGPALNAYPEANFHFAPGLSEKRPDLPQGSALTDSPPDGWRGVLEQKVITGFSAANEVAFLHTPTRTLVLTDLAFHIGPGFPWFTRMVFRLLRLTARVGVAPDIRRDLQRHPQSKQEIAQVLSWEFDRVVLAHGAIVEAEAREALVQAFSFLGELPGPA